MPWLQARISSNAATADQIADCLTAAGAQAVTYTDAKDTPWYEPKPGEPRYWPDTLVTGLFAADHDSQAILAALSKVASFAPQTDFRLEPLEDKDWEREWMDNFHPIQCGQRLWICPSWRDIPNPKAVNVLLDPGLAFGTGTHPTTFLCLQWLDGLDLSGKTLVDFGCGSGILAIAALKLGAKRVIGIDIDPQALQASQDNAERNGVAEKLEVYLPDDQPKLEADIVVANILAGPLRDLRKIITAYCKPGGHLALSGILASQAEEISALYAQDFQLNPSATQDEWARVDGVKL